MIDFQSLKDIEFNPKDCYQLQSVFVLKGDTYVDSDEHYYVRAISERLDQEARVNGENSKAPKISISSLADYERCERIYFSLREKNAKLFAQYQSLLTQVRRGAMSQFPQLHTLFIQISKDKSTFLEFNKLQERDDNYVYSYAPIDQVLKSIQGEGVKENCNIAVACNEETERLAELSDLCKLYARRTSLAYSLLEASILCRINKNFSDVDFVLLDINNRTYTLSKHGEWGYPKLDAFAKKTLLFK